MAVGPGTLPTFYPVAGVKLGIGSAGIKKPGRKDIVVIELAPGSRAAGIFTRNQFCAAPVHVTRSHLASDAPRYLLINTGNANAGTGARGVEDAQACCQALADQAGVAAGSVLPFSTGVIGEPLPVAKRGPAAGAGGCIGVPLAGGGLRNNDHGYPSQGGEPPDRS